MMGTNYVESSLKRFLKRKVKITLGLVVVFMITGSVGYAKDIAIGGLWDEWSVNEEVKQEITIENNMLTTENNNLSITTGKVGIGYNGTVNVIDGNLAINAGSNGILSGYGKESQVNILANEVNIESGDNGIFTTWGDGLSDWFKGYKGYVKIGSEDRKIDKLSIVAGGQGIDNKKGKVEIYGSDNSVISITSNGISGDLDDQAGVYNSDSAGIVDIKGGTIDVVANGGSGVYTSSGKIILDAKEDISISGNEASNENTGKVNGIYTSGTTTLTAGGNISVSSKETFGTANGINTKSGTAILTAGENILVTSSTNSGTVNGVNTSGGTVTLTSQTGDIAIIGTSYSGTVNGVNTSEGTTTLTSQTGNIFITSDTIYGEAKGIFTSGGTTTLDGKAVEISTKSNKNTAYGLANGGITKITGNDKIKILTISGEKNSYGLYQKNNKGSFDVSSKGDFENISIAAGHSYGVYLYSSENQQKISADNDVNILAYSSFSGIDYQGKNYGDAYGIYMFGTNNLDVTSGNNINIKAISEGNAYGINTNSTGNNHNKINLTAIEGSINILTLAEKKAAGIDASLNTTTELTAKGNIEITALNKADTAGYGIYINGTDETLKEKTKVSLLSTDGDIIINTANSGTENNNVNSTSYGISNKYGNVDLTANNIIINTFASNRDTTNSAGISTDNGNITLTAKNSINISSKSNTGLTNGLFLTGNSVSEAKLTAASIEILVESNNQGNGIKTSSINNKATLESTENIIVSSKSNIETASTGYTTGLYNGGNLSLKGDGVISISSATIGENTYGAFNVGKNLDLIGKTKDESTTIFISSQSKTGTSTGLHGQYGATNTLKGEDIAVASVSENGTSYGVFGHQNENILTGTNISIVSEGRASSIGLYGAAGAENLLTGEEDIFISSTSTNGSSQGISSNNSTLKINSLNNNIEIFSSADTGSYGIASWNGATLDMIAKEDIIIGSKTNSGTSYGTFLAGKADLKSTGKEGIVQIESFSNKGTSYGLYENGYVNISSENINIISGGIEENKTGKNAYGIYGIYGSIDMTSKNIFVTANSAGKEAYGIFANRNNINTEGNTVVSVSGKKIESGDLQNNSHAAEVLAEGNNTISKLFLDGNNTGAVTQGIRAYNSTMTFNGSLTSVSSDIAMTSIGENSNITVNEGTHYFEGNSYLIDAAGDYSGSLIVRPVIQSLDGGNITLKGDTTVISRTAEDDTEDHISNAGIYVQGHTDADKDTTSSININGNLTVVSGNDNFDENNGDFSYEDIYTEKVKDIIKSTDIALMATSKAEINVNSKDKNVFLIGDIVAGKDGSKISIEGGKLDSSSGLPSMVVVGEVLGANGGTVSLDMSNGGYFAGRVDDYNKIDEFKDTDFRDNKFESDIEKGGTVTLKMDNGAVWNVIGQSYVTNLEFGAKGGTVDLTFEGNALRVMNLKGQGTFDLVLYGDSDAQHEKSEGNMLYIYNAENAGEQTVNLAESALYIDYGEKVRFATLGKDAYGKVSFVVDDVKEEGINDVSYSTEYEEYDRTDDQNSVYNGDKANNNKPGDELVSNEEKGFDATENWYLTRAKEKINDNGQTVIEMAKANYASAVYMDNLNKRLGDMSFVEGNEGLWVRMRNDRVGEDSEYRLRNYMTQIGYDKTYDLDDGKEYRGIALDYTQGEMEYKNIHGESNIDRYTFTAYDTRVYNSGAYADYVARAGYMESDFEIYGRQTGNKAEGDFDNLYFGLSAEFGKRYNFGEEERSYFEPQVQLQYTYIDDTDYTTNQNTKVDYDNIHSLIGRAGFRLGHDFYEEDSKDNTIYLKADINHEFLGDQDVSAMDLTGKLDETYHNDGTWYDVGIGGAKNLSENLYVYADVERQFGTGKDNSWQFNLGFRYKFGTLEDFTLTNLFDFDKSEIKPEGKQVINDAAVKLNKKNVKGTVVIEGHTDWYGSEEYNQVLSEKRAKAVEEQLKNTVTNEKVQIESKGYGETKPVADNNTPEGRAQNRRVEVKYSR